MNSTVLLPLAITPPVHGSDGEKESYPLSHPWNLNKHTFFHRATMGPNVSKSIEEVRQQNTSPYIAWVKSRKEITILTKEEAEECLEVRESTIPGAGNGLFAKKFIPAGTHIDVTFILNTNEKNFGRQCNDLGYRGSAEEYENTPEEEMKKHINIMYTNFFVEYPFILTAAETTMRDIQPGEELSRYYGPEYWYNYEIHERNKDNMVDFLPAGKYAATPDPAMKPDKYYHLFYRNVADEEGNVIGYEYRLSVSERVSNLFMKPKLFHALPVRKTIPEEDEMEADSNVFLIDVTKPDCSRFSPEEPIVVYGSRNSVLLLFSRK